MGDFGSNMIYSYTLMNFVLLFERARQMVRRNLYYRSEEYKK